MLRSAGQDRSEVFQLVVMGTGPVGKTSLINALLADGAAVEVLYVHGHWRGVNDLAEFRDAVDFAHGHAADAAAGAGYGRDDD